MGTGEDQALPKAPGCRGATAKTRGHSLARRVGRQASVGAGERSGDPELEEGLRHQGQPPVARAEPSKEGER